VKNFQGELIMPTIAIINQSDVADADLALWVNAVQHQLVEDVAQFWSLAGETILVMISQGFQAPAGSWQIIVAPNTDITNDLGYHENTAFGTPLGKVFTQTTLGFAQTISRVLSHEIIEMIADPQVQTKVTIAGTTYLAEACDPVHYDALGYPKQGVLVSDFVTPTYYGLPLPDGTTDPRVAFNTALSGPCPALPRGGALIVVQPGGSLTMQVAPDSSWAERQFLTPIREGSRRQRYQMGYQNWRNSIR
jgi:hypothetical protein